MWTALFGYSQPLSIVLIERCAVFAAILPWLMLLERTAGTEFRWRRAIPRSALVIWLIDRMIVDFAFWAPIAVLVAAGWLGSVTSFAARVADRAYPFKRVVLELLLGLGLAAMLAQGCAVRSVQYAAMVVFLRGFYRRRTLPSSDPSHVEVNGAQWRTSFWPNMGELIGGGVLLAVGGGMTREGFVPMVVGGFAGWTAVRFVCWRIRRAGSGRRFFAEPTQVPAKDAGEGPVPHHRKTTISVKMISSVASGLAGLFLVLLGAELYFRHIYDATDTNGQLRTTEHWVARHVVTNSWGHRDREFPPTDQLGSGPRVVVLGDSFAFGWGIKDRADMLGPQLERELVRRGNPSSQVFILANAGVNTRWELGIFARDGQRLRPHVVVLMYHLNDIDGPNRRSPVAGPAFQMWEPITKSSDFLQFFHWHLFLRFGRIGHADNESLSDYRDESVFTRQAGDLESLLKAIRDSGAVPIVLLYPFLNAPTDAGPQRYALDRIAEVLQHEDVAFIDVSRQVNVNEGRFHVNRFDAHPSPELHRVIIPVLAGRVLDALGRNGQTRPIF